MLASMLRIRTVEEHVGDLALSGDARCPCHLAIGQEAAAVGVSQYLRASDRVFGAHRSHSHYLALGGDVQALLDEILGKVTGTSKGMGGSMHLYGEPVGFKGSVPIVAGTVPLAVGAAMAARMDGKGDVAVAYFGDGAAEEGVVHESMNLAARYRAPVLFACENNLYSSHLDIAQRQPSDRISRYAEAHRIPSLVVDGNDVLAVADASRELVGRMRAGEGPMFLEAVTYRWRGHVGPDVNIDVGLRRRESDVLAWRQRDPIRRLRDALSVAGLLDDAAYQGLVEGIGEAVAAAVDRAKQAAYPGDSALLDLVYRGGHA
ncbi:MAG: thiamine pyrophosphate-dependent dehydrogenase E1 component subunit alpha [Gammaproteobacteria bacterium]|nr:thiamine pyrophosphate-dependent dehydrogenase E1 component subunit alpha [Gammaproteobacteria bacterium]